MISKIQYTNIQNHCWIQTIDSKLTKMYPLYTQTSYWQLWISKARSRLFRFVFFWRPLTGPEMKALKIYDAQSMCPRKKMRFAQCFKDKKTQWKRMRERGEVEYIFHMIREKMKQRKKRFYYRDDSYKPALVWTSLCCERLMQPVLTLAWSWNWWCMYEHLLAKWTQICCTNIHGSPVPNSPWR